MSRYTILVEFELKPGTMDEFLGLIVANARASRDTEEGCLQFDVLRPTGSDNHIILYEIYEDAAAFAAHGETAHFEAFDRASRDLVVTKRVTVLETIAG